MVCHWTGQWDWMSVGLIIITTSCAGGRHNMPQPCDLDLWPFDLESGVRVTCDVGYLCANFSVPRPLFFLDLGPMYTTDIGQHHRLMPPPRGRGHNSRFYIAPYGRNFRGAGMWQQVMDEFEGDQFFVMTMEKHGSGVDLFEFIENASCISEQLASYIFRQVACRLCCCRRDYHHVA